MKKVMCLFFLLVASGLCFGADKTVIATFDSPAMHNGTSGTFKLFKDGAQFSFQNVAPGETSKQFVLPSVTNGQVWHYTLQYSNATGPSVVSTSPAITVTGIPEPPSAPENLTFDFVD